MADTNWVITNFAIIQEGGGNMFTEDGFTICLEEFDKYSLGNRYGNWQWLKKYMM
jgi:hypothetical protein